MNRLMNPKPRRRVLDILTENNEEASVSPMSREEARTDLEAILRSLKKHGSQEAIHQENDLANDNPQTRFEDQAREKALALDRVKIVREKHAEKHADRMQREYEEQEKNLAVAEKREMYQKYFKNEKKAILKDPLGWFEGKPAAEDFPRFLEIPQQAMTAFMCTVLRVAGEELVPYHYVAGKVIKNLDGTRRGLRKKPQMEVLVALSAVHHKKVRKALDAARNVL